MTHGLRDSLLRRASTRRLLPAVVFLMVLAVVPYLAFLDGYFLADDLMLDYFLLEDGALSWSKVLYHFFPTEGYVTRQIYRPLDFVVLSVDWIFWGTNPVGYHLSNLAFHVWCTLVVFFLIRRIGRAADLLPAVFGASLFALHPLNPEAVQWIVGRVDLTSCFFTLLALLCFVRYRRTRRTPFLIATLVATALGLLSKDVVVAIPLYFVLYDLWLARPFRRWRESRWDLLAPHVYTVLMIAGYFVLRLACFGSFFGKYGSSGEAVSAGIQNHWTEGIGRVIGLLEQLVYPIRRSPYTASESTAIWICLTLGYLSLVFMAVAHGLTRGTRPIRRAALFGGLWLAATLIPLVYLLVLLPVTADHLNARLAYLPVAAFCVGLPLVLFSGERWNERPWIRRRIAVCLIVPTLYLPLCSIHAELFYRAGRDVKAFKRQVVERYRAAAPDTPVLIENPPLERNGVYVLRTGLSYLLKPPFAPIHVPALGLNLTEDEELGRVLAHHPTRPLILHWDQKERHVEVVTRSDPVRNPVWEGDALGGLEALGATRKVTPSGLLVTPDRPGDGFRVRTPLLHVRPGDVDSLVIDLKLMGDAPVALPVRFLARDGDGEPHTFARTIDPVIQPGAPHRRIVPLRFQLETYGRRVGHRFTGYRRIERIELLFSGACRKAEIRSLKVLAGFPRITLTAPPPRHEFRVEDGVPGFRFLALDGLRYYALVLDIEGLGVRRAHFDAYALNDDRPVRAGDSVTKPADRTGNLDQGSDNFAIDLAHAPANPDDQPLSFTWRIEALADPDRPWIIAARSETRNASIR